MQSQLGKSLRAQTTAPPRQTIRSSARQPTEQPRKSLPNPSITPNKHQTAEIGPKAFGVGLLSLVRLEAECVCVHIRRGFRAAIGPKVASALGQSRPNWAVRTMSGLPPLATELRTSLLVRFVPRPELSSLHGRRVIDRLSLLDRFDNLDILDRHRLDLERVLVENDEVGELPCL